MHFMKFAIISCSLAAALAASVSKADEKGETKELAAILEGATNGSYLKIPAGKYRCAKTLSIRDKKNLIVDAAGVTVIMTNHVNAFDIRSCENLEIKGFTIDYDPLPFTQATLSSYDPIGMTGEITLMKGYPRLDQFQNQGTIMVFDPKTRNWKRDSYGFYATSFESAGLDNAKITVRAPADANLAAGDLLVIERRDVAALNIVLTSNFTLDGLTVHAAPGIAIIGRYCSGQQIIKNVKIEKGPKPEGADFERLYSTGADGLNYAICRQGPTVLNCDFGFMGDDSINFHGETLPIHMVEPDGSLILCKVGGKSPLLDMVQPGDKVQVMNPDTFAIENEGVVSGKMEFVETRNSSAEDKDYLCKLFPSRKKANNEKISFYRLKFEKPITASVGQWIDIPALNCPGYSIIGNRFHDHRARGLRIMAQDGVIADNRFERIGQSAISIGAEYNYWRESGWCRNIVIARNIIKDCGIHMDATMPGAYACGAISVFTYRAKDAKEIFKGHKNIVIDSNIVEGNSSAGIHLYGTQGAFITNNIISDTLKRNITKTGSDRGLKVDGPITIFDSEETIVRGNVVK